MEDESCRCYGSHRVSQAEVLLPRTNLCAQKMCNLADHQVHRMNFLGECSNSGHAPMTGGGTSRRASLATLAQVIALPLLV